MSNQLWNVWVQISNLQDREFIFRGTHEDASNLRDFLANRDHVVGFDIAEESAEFDANDVKEEVGQWISDEIE